MAKTEVQFGGKPAPLAVTLEATSEGGYTWEFLIEDEDGKSVAMYKIEFGACDE